MNKKFTRIFSLLIVFLLSLSFYPSSLVKAEDSDIDINKMIEDNYWIDFKTVDKFGMTYLVPEGADLTEKSFLKNLAENDMDNMNKMNYNTGFRTDRNALFDIMNKDASFWVKEAITRDYSDKKSFFIPTPDGKKVYIFKDGKAYNPLNFDIDNKTIVNTDDYNMYADLVNAKNNNTNNVDKFRVGDSFDLDFVVDTSILTKYQNTRFLSTVNTQGALEDVWLEDHGIVLADDIYVFNLDFPKGIDINERNLELVGLEGYNKEIQIDKVGDRIKVRVVADEDKERDIVSVKDFFNKLNNSNERIILRIKNLKINSAANTAGENQIRASFGGMHDLCMTYDTNRDELLSKDENDRKYIQYFKKKECFINRDIVSFAAKQSKEGKDAAADPHKQYLISYTFNVEERKASHNPVVTFINDDRFYDEREVYEGTSINQNSYMPRDPEKRGYKFIEWNTMPDGSGMTFTGDTVVYEDMTVYAIYKKDRRYDDERETADEEPMLNINDHYQYMVGYKDATFRPNNNMTREEVAVMFSRLMVRRPIKGHIYNHNFKDLSNTRWSATAISYMNELGLIKGYPDGTFKPEKSITRAEFAAMATRFANLFGGGLQGFVDVPYTHWANDVIAKAASAGWVSGYPDGTFKPENKITRAEVVSITNRMLTRRADKDFITKHRSAILRFTDTPTHWAFYDIVEACNGHDYTRQGTIEENWLNVNLKTFVYDK